MFIYAATSESEFAGQVELTGRMLGTRTKSVRFECGLGVSWLPISRLKMEPNRDGTVTVRMPMWLAKSRGYV